MKSNYFFSLVLLFLICTACSPKYGVSLQNGDILFVASGAGALSQAIDKVTQTEKTTHYSHVAILEIDRSGQYWVLHAGSQNGSERIPLDEFLKYERGRQIDVYRLKSDYQSAIPQAIAVAKTWLGKPYNYSYILSDKKLYCSDFVQRSFEGDSIFKLEPMTFIDPETGEIGTTWKTFYAKQNLEVPEGKLGCNPNGLAASSKIKFIDELNNAMQFHKTFENVNK